MPCIRRPTAQHREGILDAAHTLFTTRGLQPTTMEDTLRIVGIAKGTPYYHFPSKEQVLEALVLRIVYQVEQQAREIAASSAPAADKLVVITSAMKLMGTEIGLANQFHAPGSVGFHLLPIAATIEHLAPALAEVIAQGVAERTFATERPHNAIELLLSASDVLLDQDVMEPSLAELARHQETLIWASEALLGVAPDSLDFLTKAEP